MNLDTNWISITVVGIGTWGNLTGSCEASWKNSEVF